MIKQIPRDFKINVFKGSIYGALGTLFPSIFLLYYIDLVSKNSVASELSIFYLCYSSLMLLSLVDFGLGFKFLMSRWCLKSLLIRGAFSVGCLLLLIESMNFYIRLKFDTNINTNYLLISAMSLWLGNFLKYIFDRSKLFFFGSLIQIMPSILIFMTQANNSNKSLFRENSLFTSSELFLMITQISLLAFLLVRYRTRSIAGDGNFRLEITYSVTLFLALLTVRFDRLWLANLATYEDLAIYYTVTEVCMRMGFLGAMVSRVSIPYLSDEKNKIPRLTWRLEQRIVFGSFFAFLPVFLVLIYVYLPQPSGLDFFYTSIICTLSMVCLLIGQIFYTFLIVAKGTQYIVLSQLSTLVFYVAITSMVKLDYQMLLLTWVLRIAFEVLCLRILYTSRAIKVSD